MATSWIPEIPADVFSWQHPVLAVETLEDGSYYQTTLDGRIISADRRLHQTSWNSFIAHYPENPHLEEDINRLPVLYRPGLKLLLYVKRNKPEDKRYMSMLVWLNGLAAKIYKRHNCTELPHPAVWYKTKEDVEEIRKFGLKLKLEAEAGVAYHCFGIREYLELLDVKNFAVLTPGEVSVITELVIYMMQVNNSIAQDQNLIYENKHKVYLTYPSQRKGQEVYFSEAGIVEYFMDKKQLTAYKSQDTVAPSEEEMDCFLKMYQI